MHVESTTHRRVSNRTDDDLVLFIVGGKGGYVERDGHSSAPEIDLREAAGALAMNGLMMDFQLTLPIAAAAVEPYFGDKEIVTRLPDKSFHRYTYRDSCAQGARARGRRCKDSASSAATASRRSAGTTTSTTRRTSASRAAASSCTR